MDFPDFDLDRLASALAGDAIGTVGLFLDGLAALGVGASAAESSLLVDSSAHLPPAQL
jgi:hypothetical protein